MFLSKNFSNFRHIYFLNTCSKFNQEIKILNRNLSIFPRNENKTENIKLVTNIDSKIDEFYLPEPPTSLDLFEPVDLTLSYNHLGEATFKSLGLNSNWPTGWVQAAFESLHVNFELPWWAVIVIGAVAVRAIMFPFSIKIRKLSMKSKEIAPLISDLQKKIELAKISNDMVTAAKAVRDLEVLIVKSDYRPYKAAFYPMLQIPPFVAIMMGLRQMANLPVASLQTGGLFWFTDLTMYDPYYILPISTMGLLLLQMEIGADIGKQIKSGYSKWALRAIPIVGILFTCNFPSALLLYWWSSSILSLSIAGFMKLPLVRDKLGMQAFDKAMLADKPVKKSQGFMQEWKKNSIEKRTMQMAKQAESTDNEQWLKAGTTAVPKTFSYDPTKVRSTQSGKN